MPAQVVADTADGVYGILPDITLAISVKINGIGTIAAGNKLAVTHCAGIRTQRGQRIQVFLPGKQQKMSELRAEKRTAWRIVKGQRGQRINHSIAALVTTVHGFNANNGRNHLCWYPILLFGACQGGLILLHKRPPLTHTALCEKNILVSFPGQDPLRRSRDGINNTLLKTGIGKYRA